MCVGLLSSCFAGTLRVRNNTSRSCEVKVQAAGETSYRNIGSVSRYSSKDFSVTGYVRVFVNNCLSGKRWSGTISEEGTKTVILPVPPPPQDPQSGK